MENVQEKTIVETIAQENKSHMGEEVLSCQNLVKDFDVAGKIQHVIKGITLSFKQGEFVSIMGQSGSGKSTFMYLLSGIEKNTSGKIMMLGKDLSKYSSREISKLRSTQISFVFQSYNLIPNFTVYENVITPLCLGKKKVKEQEIDAILQRVGIRKYKNSEVSKLSGGEQQRVAIARALVTQPKIMFADEATGNLDSKTRVEVMTLFKEINKETGVTIIQVTHDPLCARYGDRVITLKDGTIISDEKVKEEDRL